MTIAVIVHSYDSAPYYIKFCFYIHCVTVTYTRLAQNVSRSRQRIVLNDSKSEVNWNRNEAAHIGKHL